MFLALARWLVLAAVVAVALQNATPNSTAYDHVNL